MSMEELTPEEKKYWEIFDRKFQQLMKMSPQNLEPSISQPASTSESQKKEHWKAEKILKDAESCPECRAEAEKIFKAWAKKVYEARANKPYQCKACGTGVDKDEKECPTCGGTQARER